MGSIAARKTAKIVEHVRHILATELFCATQALRFREPLKPGDGVLSAYRFLTEHIPPITEDRVFAPEIERVAGWITDGSLLNSVESSIGGLS